MHSRSRPSPAFRQGRNERAERNHELQRNPVTRRAHSTDAVPSRARSSGLAAVSATVTVDGRRWKQLGSLAELGQASPDSQVFALDDATGAVRFGDGRPRRTAARRRDSARAVPTRQWCRRKRTDLVGRPLASSGTGRGHDASTGLPCATPAAQAQRHVLTRNSAVVCARPRARRGSNPLCRGELQRRAVVTEHHAVPLHPRRPCLS